MIDRSQLIPEKSIKNEEVAILSEEAKKFLLSHKWCNSIIEVNLSFSIAGIIGVFLIKIEPTDLHIDDELWVVVGDLPPAYFVTDHICDWQEALKVYVSEMNLWVDAVRSGSPLEDIIPVNAQSSLENADLLEKRLVFIKNEFVNRNIEEFESDS